jgi:hypothetical protein
MSEITDRPCAPPAKLLLPQAFAVGYAVWLVPCVVRYALGVVTARQCLYAGLWLALLHTVALSVITLVYRTASARGVSLKRAVILSLSAAVPATTLSYLIDLLVSGWDPTLSAHRHEAANALDAVLIALSDSLASASLLAAIVFLPVFARAHEQRSVEIAHLFATGRTSSRISCSTRSTPWRGWWKKTRHKRGSCSPRSATCFGMPRRFTPRIAWPTKLPGSNAT